jgi:RNA polymerase sigma-70 factor (ECF subfamily)
LSRELVQQAMLGNRDAFGVLVDRALPRMIGTAGLILRDRGWAEDAAQEALVRAWRDLPTLRDPDRFDAWLHRLLARSCQDQLRRHRHELTDAELLRDMPRAAPDAGDRLGNRDEVERGLRRLTDEQRLLIVLRYYLGLTDAEVADATHLPIGTVKSRIFRALDALRGALEAEARSSLPTVEELRP